MVWSNQAPTSLTFPPGATTGARLTLDQNGLTLYGTDGGIILQIEPGEPGTLIPGIAFPNPAEFGAITWITQILAQPFTDSQFQIFYDNTTNSVKIQFFNGLGPSSTLVAEFTANALIARDQFKVGAGDLGKYYYEEGNFGSPGIGLTTFASFTLAPTLAESDYGTAVGTGHWVCPVTGLYDFSFFAQLSLSSVTRLEVTGTSGPNSSGAIYAADSKTYVSGGANIYSELAWTKHHVAGDTVYMNILATFTGAPTIANNAWSIGRRL